MLPYLRVLYSNYELASLQGCTKVCTMVVSVVRQLHQGFTTTCILLMASLLVVVVLPPHVFY